MRNIIEHRFPRLHGWVRESKTVHQPSNSTLTDRLDIDLKSGAEEVAYSYYFHSEEKPTVDKVFYATQLTYDMAPPFIHNVSHDDISPSTSIVKQPGEMSITTYRKRNLKLVKTKVNVFDYTWALGRYSINMRLSYVIRGEKQ